jgi:Na+/melibiose symporter-like transporter
MSATDSKSEIMEPSREPSHTGEGPEKPLSAGKIFGYSLANLGYGMFHALNNAALPLFLQKYTGDARLIGLMGSSHSFEGAIIQPLVGNASDRLRTKWGRRRPFMMVFIPLCALFLILTPIASHLPVSLRLGAILASIFLFTVFFNIAADPYQAMMPDITPVSQRGRVTGFYMLAGVLGQAALMLLHMEISLKFILSAVLMLVTTFLTCVLVNEPSLPAKSESGPHRSPIAEALNGLRPLRQTRKALAAIFCAGLGIGAVFPFLTLFIKTITRGTDQQAQQMFMVLMVATAVGVLPFGRIVDRIGPKRMLLFGQGLIALAALNGLWVETLPQITVVMALAGLGNAAQSVSAYPLLTELVPAGEVGFYTGLQSTANSIAAPVTAFLTGELINQGGHNYRIIFAVCAFFLAGSIAILTQVRLKDANAEIAERERETGKIA